MVHPGLEPGVLFPSLFPKASEPVIPSLRSGRALSAAGAKDLLFQILPSRACRALAQDDKARGVQKRGREGRGRCTKTPGRGPGVSLPTTGPTFFGSPRASARGQTNFFATISKNLVTHTAAGTRSLCPRFGGTCEAPRVGRMALSWSATARCRRGGMADAEVSQASGRKPVRVRIPPPARPHSRLTYQ